MDMYYSGKGPPENSISSKLKSNQFLNSTFAIDYYLRYNLFNMVHIWVEGCTSFFFSNRETWFIFLFSTLMVGVILQDWFLRYPSLVCKMNWNESCEMKWSNETQILTRKSRWPDGVSKSSSGKVTALIKLAAEFNVEQNRSITSCRWNSSNWQTVMTASLP
jgi:hypothetical protein